MGDIADDMLDGSCCSMCGTYFTDGEAPEGVADDIEVHSHGHPVVCAECWEDLTPKERRGYSRARADTL